MTDDVAAHLARADQARQKYHAGDLDSLHQAIDAYRSALAAGDRTATTPLDAAQVLCLRYQHFGDRPDLDQALDLAITALPRMPADHPRLPDAHNTLVSVRLLRFQCTGAPAELDLAITTGREGLDRAGSATTFSLASNLATALRLRFGLTGRLEDLDRSIDSAREASTAGADQPAGAVARASLAGSLLDRFRLLDRETDLAEALQHASTASAQPQLGPLDRMSVLGVAMAVHLCHFEHTGDLAGLVAAMTSSEQLIAGLDDRHVEAGLHRLNLATLHRLRFSVLGSVDDLTTAQELLREAAHSADPGVRLDSLVAAANLVLQRLGDGNEELSAEERDLVDAAVRDAEAAVAIAPRQSLRYADSLLVLLNALATRSDATGDHEHEDRWISRAVADATELPHGPKRDALVLTLASRQARRAHRDRNADDLEAAEQKLKQVTSSGPLRAQAVARTVAVLATRITWGASSAADELVALLTELHGTAACTAANRVLAGAAAGAALAHLDDDRAPAAYRSAIAGFPAAAWHGLDRRSQEAQLVDLQGIGCTAAAAHLRWDRPDEAVECLELGRAVLWSQLLDRSPADRRLATDHPELVARLDRLAVALRVADVG